MTTWTTVYDKTSVMTADDPGLSNTSIREFISSSNLSSASGSFVRLTFKFAGGTNTGTITAVYFGLSAANVAGANLNFTGTKTQIHFSGGATSFAAGGTVISDGTDTLNVAFDNTKHMLVAADLNAGAFDFADGTSTGDVFYYNTDAAVNDTSTDRGSVADLAYFLSKIEIGSADELMSQAWM